MAGEIKTIGDIIFAGAQALGIDTDNVDLKALMEDPSYSTAVSADNFVKTVKNSIPTFAQAKEHEGISSWFYNKDHGAMHGKMAEIQERAAKHMATEAVIPP